MQAPRESIRSRLSERSVRMNGSASPLFGRRHKDRFLPIFRAIVQCSIHMDREPGVPALETSCPAFKTPSAPSAHCAVQLITLAPLGAG